MSTTSTSIPNEHPFRRRLIAELLSVPRALFWLGVLWFVLGVLIDFVPGGEQGWFTIAAVLTPFGFFVPQRRYRIAALVFVVLSTFAAFNGHKRGIEYHQFSARSQAELGNSHWSEVSLRREGVSSGGLRLAHPEEHARRAK